MPQPLPTFATTPTLDELAASAPPSPAAVAPLSFFDTVKLGYREDQARPSWGFNETNWKNSAISEIEDGLRKKGIQPTVDLMDPGDAIGRSIQPGENYAAAENRVYSQVLAQVHQVQQGDPNFLPDFAGVVDKGSFDRLVTERQKAQLQSVAEKAPDGLGIGGLVGAIAHGQLDPVNYIPILGEGGEGLSFGRRLLQQGLKFGAFNMGITAVSEPMVREHAQALGIQRSGADFLTDLLSAGATGAVLGGGIEALRFGGGKLRDALRKPQAEPAPAAPPEAAQPAPATGAPFDSFDAKVAKTFADAVPPEQRTPDEQAAIHAINRDGEIRATSPFVPGPGGDDAHYQSLDTAMRVINDPGAAAPRGPARPIARESIAGPPDVEATRMPARELVKAKIHAAEGDGPNRAGGSALGPYQFEPRTWVGLFKRRYPSDTRSFDQIAALREDPQLNDVLINDLLSENAAALRHAGFAETPGNLYLAHVLGHDRAVTLLRADPEAKLGGLLPEGYFKGNPFRDTDTAASLVKWAYRKMGDEASAPVHADPEIDAAATSGADAITAGEGDPEIDTSTGRFDVEALYGDIGMTDRPVLKPELFDSPEAHAAAQLRFERSSDAADGFAPVMSRAEVFAPSDHFDALRRYAANRGTVTPEAIGEALGVSPDEARRVVASMQALDRNSPYMLSVGKRPIIRRPPPRSASRGPETMLDYVTRTGGGIRDTGGDLAHIGGDAFHREKPFRRKLIDNERGQTLDQAFQRAIDGGYFPEHMVSAEKYADLPDPQDFLDAVDAELRGSPRFAPDDYADVAAAAQRVKYGEEPDAGPRFGPVDGEAAADRAQRLFELTGHNQEAIGEAARRRGITITDDEMLADASDLVDAGLDPDDALDHAALAAMARDLHEFAAISGEMGYEPSDGTAAYIGDVPEIRGDGGDDGQTEPGDGRPAPSAVGAEAGGDALAQLAHDPEAGRFSDPIGDAAETQADSAIHDIEMQQRPAVEGEAAPEADDTTYRLDDEGGEHDVKSILDEIGEEQKAVDELRGCLKPKGPGE